MSRYATLVKHCGFACNREEELVSSLPFVGQKGKVIDVDDDRYNTDRPTGYESCFYLVDFTTEKLWIPKKCFLGEDENGKERWETYLVISKE